MLRFSSQFEFQTKFKIKFSKYTLENLHKESDLFFDWYLKYTLKNNNINKIKRLLRKELNLVYKKSKIKTSPSRQFNWVP